MRTEEEIRIRRDRIQNEILASVDNRTIGILEWRLYELDYVLQYDKLYRCGCGCRFTDHNLLSQFTYLDNTMVKCGTHGEHILTRGVK